MLHMIVTKKQDIIENLKDAGCKEEDILSFLKELEEGNKKSSQQRLIKHRKDLLNELHRFQKRIDCLDYFIYKLEKDEVHLHV